MAFIGAKQTVNAAVTIAAAAIGSLGYATGIGGAIGLLVRIRGGSNSANNLLSLGATLVADTAQAGVAAGGIGLNLVGGTIGKTNGDTHTAQIYYFALSPNDGATFAFGRFPFPTATAQITARMLSADSTGCVVEAWPIYDTEPRAMGGSSLSDLNTY